MYNDIERPSPELIARLAKYRSSDMSDAMNRAQTMSGIKPIYEPVPRVVGPAVTVNSIVPSINAGKMGLERCQPGDVLVVACPAAVAHAVWGGNLAYGTKSRGVAGLVIDGAVRDVSEIRDVGLPTFSSHIVTMAAPIFTPQGEVNVPIACGGVVVFPGDIIVADDDGIVVIPPAYAEQVMEATDAVNAKAASVQEILGRGEITNLAGIRSQYQNEGFENA